jgi:predicted amidophosphoribosyltransferase
LRKEIAQWEYYYPKLQVQVFAPRFYYSKVQRKDEYSKQVVFGKNQDLSDYFFARIKKLFLKLPIKPTLIIVLPSSRMGKFSPTLLALAKNLSDAFGIENDNIIERIKEGKKLTTCSNNDERHEAIKDSFKVNRNIEGKKVVLLDDTKTTGGTVLECAKELRAAGASEVVAVCLGINKFKKRKVRKNGVK